MAIVACPVVCCPGNEIEIMRQVFRQLHAACRMQHATRLLTGFLLFRQLQLLHCGLDCILVGPGETFKPKMPPALAAKRYADRAGRTALSWLCLVLPASCSIPARLSSTLIFWLQKDALSALLSIGLARPATPSATASAASVIGSGNRSRNW